MMTPAILHFMSGAIAMGYAAIAFCLFCSWRRNRIGLIGLFGVAFALLAIERVVFVLVQARDEYKPFVYLFRLAAFLVIIAGIVVQNRRRG